MIPLAIFSKLHATDYAITTPIVSRDGMLISANNDIDAMMEWVDRYKHSPNTLASIRKDAERFYLWITERGMSLGSVRKNHCEEYREFLKNPQPSEQWCGPTRPRHNEDGTSNSDWRPFVGPLKESSVLKACSQIFGLYEFLANAGYVKGNPWRLLGKLPPLEIQVDYIERFLDMDAMTLLRNHIETMKDGSAIDRKHYARVRWVFSLLYLSAARRSEFVNAKMKDVRRTNGKWWWRVKGKGGKVGDIPVNDALLKELTCYRESLGLMPFPHPDEDVPLVSDVCGKLRPITASSLYKIVKQVLNDVGDQAERLGDIESAKNLRNASTHWMRHTSATDQANAPGSDLKIVSKNLRHSSITTTSIYLHTERNNRHDQTQKHQMWDVENLETSTEVAAAESNRDN